MKEYASVDVISEHLKEFAKNEPVALLRLALTNQHACIQEALENLIADYAKLKLLKKNIREKIEKLKQENSPCHDAQVELETLESLDK